MVSVFSEASPGTCSVGFPLVIDTQTGFAITTMMAMAQIPPGHRLFILFSQQVLKAYIFNWVWWCMPVVPGPEEAKAGGWLRLRSCRPAWATYQYFVSKPKQK
jgi:hypothetical protein